MTAPGERDSLSVLDDSAPAMRGSAGPSMPVNGPGSRQRRRWFLGVSGALVLVALITFHEVLLPFLLGLVVAYVLSPLVGLGQQARIAGRHPPRWAVV